MRRLLASGANPRSDDGRETPLHLAARHGPLELVEALIEGDALDWLTDANGRTALEVARAGTARDRDAIVALLDRERIADASFAAAVAAIHTGDVADLERLIDAEPRLLRERILGPQAYRNAKRAQYFRDPKLFWYVANNPVTVARMASNICAVAETMLARGIERADLDYTLELVMSGNAAREQGLQRPLMTLLLGAGATATPRAIETAAAHGELDALRALTEAGHTLTPTIAAALGQTEALSRLLRSSDPTAIQSAFGIAVINGNVEAAKLALAAGADINAPMPAHTHTTALHQAVLQENVALLRLLLANGASTERRDTLWDATPLQWAIHQDRPIARKLLEQT